MIAVAFAAAMIMTHPTKRVTGNAIVANPHFALQYTTTDKSYTTYGGQSSWLANVGASLFGSWAGTWVAQNFR